MFDPVLYLEGTNPESSITPGEVRFIFKLAMDLVQPQATVVELGVHHGRSACLFAYIAAMKQGRYIGIDHFQCDRSSETEAWGYFRERGLCSYISIIKSATERVGWTDGIDLLHIDAGHTDPYITQDVRKYLPHLKLNGVVMFDDYEPAYPDIVRVANIHCANSGWKDLGIVEGMKCWQRI